MSGRRRSSDHDKQVEQAQSQSTSHQSDFDEQSLLGNQALSERLGGPDAAAPDLDVARDVALPLVDRGALALEIESIGADKLGRFTEILEASALGRDQRDAVLGRLNADELVARDVSDAVRAVFGEDGAGVREAVGSALDAVVDGLQNGAPEDGSWRLPDGQTVSLAADGSRANALIEAVGDTVGPASGLSSATGARILAFCQRVQLALLLDEEEEDLGPDYGTEEVAG